jgi:hypothetical protein
LQVTVTSPLQALRRAYGDKVQQPVAAHTTRWASEEFSRGSYSFVAVGCSGDDYDALALPVARRLLFAGEHTCKEHPDTVGGAAALLKTGNCIYMTAAPGARLIGGRERLRPHDMLFE